MLWFVQIPKKPIDLSFEFCRWGNWTDALNSGSKLLHFRCNQVSREFLAAETKLRSCVIHVAEVRLNVPSYEMPKCFGPYFIQLIKFKPPKAPTPCQVVSGLLEQFILKPYFGQSVKLLC